MKLKSILNLINSAHTIRVQEETKYSDCDDLHDLVHTIRTTMYGNPTTYINTDLLERNVHCIFPMRDELVIYLETDKE